jgi:hypothetical protein
MKMNHFNSISVAEISEHLANDDYHVLKLEKKFDAKLYSDKVKGIIEAFKLKNKDNYPYYKGIGLQYEDDSNPFYDAIDGLMTMEIDGTYKINRSFGSAYLKKNELAQAFTELFEYFETQVQLTRGRILISEPGNIIHEHRDGLSCAALHYVVQTDPDAKFVIDRQEYHLPADGHFYLVNASRPHYIYNKSSDARIHIVFPINPLCFKQVTQRQFQNFSNFFEQFNVEPNRYAHIKII